MASSIPEEYKAAREFQGANTLAVTHLFAFAFAFFEQLLSKSTPPFALKLLMDTTQNLPDPPKESSAFPTVAKAACMTPGLSAKLRDSRKMILESTTAIFQSYVMPDSNAAVV